jgi:hypothetical protein
MMRLVFAVLLISLPAEAETLGPDYPKNLSDFTSVHCEFDPLLDPPAPAVSLDVVRSDTTGTISWLQAGQMPMPILNGMRMPPTNVTSFFAPVTDGTMDMLSYSESGQAVLSRHGANGNGGVLWTAKLGHCDEVKG